MNLLQEATAPSAAPIDPDDLSSILSSSTGPQAFFDTESAPRPSFSSLATELKLNRVEGMAGPLRPFWEEGKEGLVVVLPEQRRVAHAAAVRDVASLRQVDREMDELCSSFVFRDVHLNHCLERPLSSMGRNAHHLRALTLGGCSGSAAIFPSAGSDCNLRPVLLSSSFSKWEVQSASIIMACTRVKSLRLDLRRCTLSFSKRSLPFTQTFAAVRVNLAHTLTEVSLLFSYICSSEADRLANFLQECTALRRLEVQQTERSVSFPHTEYDTIRTLAQSLRNCKGLESLRMAPLFFITCFPFFPSSLKSLTLLCVPFSQNSFASDISTVRHTLVKLTLDQAPWYTALRSAVSSFELSALQELTVGEFRTLDDLAPLIVGSLCLRHLHLATVSSQFLIRRTLLPLLQTCPSLRSLTIERYSGVTESAHWMVRPGHLQLQEWCWTEGIEVQLPVLQEETWLAVDFSRLRVVSSADSAQSSMEEEEEKE